jgi:hypothetical protein
MDLLCPNCGETIIPQSTTQPVSCPNCMEELEWSDDGTRLFLSKPLPTYLDPENDASELAALWERADQVEGKIEIRRRQATVELAAKRIGDRIALGNRNFKIGGGLIIFCIVMVIFAFIKTSVMDYNIPLDAFLLFILASLIIPFGFFFFVWALVDRFTIAKYVKTIQEERRILREEEQSFRN